MDKSKSKIDAETLRAWMENINRFSFLHHGCVPDNIGKHNSSELAGLKQKIYLLYERYFKKYV